MFFILNSLEENGKMKLNANKTGLGNSYAPVLHYWNKTLTVSTRSFTVFQTYLEYRLLQMLYYVLHN